MQLYDRPDIYDLVFGWDPAHERDFVLGATARWGIAEPRRVLEPFCGPGRVLRAMPGIAVGLDINAHMVREGAARGCRVFRADASRFGVARGSFDLAFCLIDSFRHLREENEALGHLRSVAQALRPGAVYVLGFDITGDDPGDVSEDRWTAEGDGIRVDAHVHGLGDTDLERRVETMRTCLDVQRGDDHERIECFSAMRVYSKRQVEDLIDREASFEIAAVFDRRYALDQPLELSEVHGSAVLVLRRE